MSDTEKQPDPQPQAEAAPAPAVQASEPEEQKVHVDEFCMHHSRVPADAEDRGKHSVELVSAFRASEVQKGTFHDTASNFLKRLHELAHSIA